MGPAFPFYPLPSRPTVAPVISRPWIIAQKWHCLLFAHWPVPAEALRPLIPARLDIETFRGQAWLTIVAFHLRGIRLRGLPPVPFTSAFPELNVRAYVVYNGQPGVWFLSLDADNVAGITLARWLYCLPYLKARMSLQKRGEQVTCCCRRVQDGAPAAEFKSTYRLQPTTFCPQPGTLAHWLTERYCFYVQGRNGRLYQGRVQHTPWLLQEAEAEIHCNTMALSHNICLPNTRPLFHYAHQLDAVFPLLEPL